MPDHKLRKLAQIRDSLDRMHQQVDQTQATMGTAEGRDQADVVTVRLDAQGKFSGVTIVEGWDEAYEPDILGTAVLSAYAAANATRMGQWSGAIEEAGQGPEPQTRPMTSTNETISGQLTELIGDDDVDLETAARGLVSDLRQLRDIMRSTVGAVEQHVQSEVAGYDPRRQVQAVVNGNGGLTDLVIDPDFAERSQAFNISQAVTQAISHALESAAKQPTEALPQMSELNAFAAKLQDPQHLAALLKPGTFDR